MFGVVCILYGLALVSGVVIYAPVFLKDLFALRLGRNIKRFWQDAHNVVGVLSLPFHVIFAWSGAVLTIGFLMLAPFQFLVFENKLLTVLEADFELAPHVEPAGVSKPMLPVAELVRRADLALPGLATESLFYHDAGDANVQVTAYGALPQRTLNGFGGVALNGASGEIIKALGPKDFPPGMAMLRGLQTLHCGNFGGFAGEVAVFPAWDDGRLPVLAEICCGSRLGVSVGRLSSRGARALWPRSRSVFAWGRWRAFQPCSW